MIRSLYDTVGESIEVEVIGNMPFAHVEKSDEKVFFMFGLVLDGNVKLKPQGDSASVIDYAWLTKSEILADYQDDADMLRVLGVVLME